MILDYQKELQEYKAKRKSYNTAVQAIQQKKVATDKAPLLANIKTIDDTDNTNNLMDPTEPEQLAALYEKISEETSTVYAADLPENCSVCGYANQRAFNNKKRELLESAEQLKTAILQAMLLNLLRDLQLNDDIIRLQTSPSLGCRAITHCLAWFNIIYGLFKGYSAVAAALVLAINISNPITIACSGVSALLFGAMSYLFEGREIYKAGHATGNTGSVNKQIGQQYGLAVEMSNLIIQETQRTPEQPPSAQAAAIIPMEPRSPKMERYHQALDRITHCDLSNKIDTAKKYSANVSNSNMHRGAAMAMGAVLATLNGFAYGFVGISTATLILKCSALTLLLGGLSMATCGGVWAAIGVLFMAGFAAAWYAKKFGPSFVQATLQEPALIKIAEDETKDRQASSLKTKSTQISNFFKLQKATTNQGQAHPLRLENAA